MESKLILESTEIISPPSQIKFVIHKVIQNQRISKDDAMLLYQHAELGILSLLATHVKEKATGNKVFFNKNVHIEPTNICVYNCKFCSYRRKAGENGSWELSRKEILDRVYELKNSELTEIHIVGGTHPDWDIYYWGDVLAEIKKVRPDICIKAFTAVELDYMIKIAGISVQDGLRYLKEKGLDFIPGGGAEIFDEEIRKQVCHEKINDTQWLDIHRTAHLLGIRSNATMLYGHIENYQHRIDHMDSLRRLQDKTKGFSAFIPLKFKNKNNRLSNLGEVSIIDDLKNYAISRIFLDNIPHIKAYWPMLGKDKSMISLSFGVSDMDGTIEDSTKIYSMAGAEDKHPSMTEDEMVRLIKNCGLIAVERDTFYKEKKVYG